MHVNLAVLTPMLSPMAVVVTASTCVAVFVFCVRGLALWFPLPKFVTLLAPRLVF